MHHEKLAIFQDICMYRKFSLTTACRKTCDLGITACRCLASRIKFNGMPLNPKPGFFWHAVKLETRPETLGIRFIILSHVFKRSIVSSVLERTLTVIERHRML